MLPFHCVYIRAQGNCPKPYLNGKPQLSLEPDFPTPQSAFESDISEIILCQNEVDLALKNLQTWMKDESVSTNLVSTVG